MRQPSLFVSHGAPTIVIDESPAHHFLKRWSEGRARPDAILVATAHFEAPGPALTTGAQPGMIYDFGGFPKPLYEMQYPAPGSPALAEQAGALLHDAGFSPRSAPTRGYDHGAWTPLMLMYPDADIPVVQLSVDPTRDAAWHAAAGRALAPLRDENVLIVGSGSLTHDLRAFFSGAPAADAPPLPYVSAFTDWAHAALGANRREALLDWVAEAPHALRNHPTPEHWLPLFVAMGASEAGGERVHHSYSHGILSMDAYAFA